MNSKKFKIARVATVPSAFLGLTKNFEDYINSGYELDLICSEDEFTKVLRDQFGFNIIHCEIPRNISVFKDIVAVFKLARIFLKNDYDIVHSNTPKAGLISALAGILSFQNIRLHTFTGQRWVTTSNPLRFVLKFLDKLVISLNTRCYADSPTQIQFLVSENVAKKGQIHCLGHGSIGGIDPNRFNTIDKDKNYLTLRKQLNIAENAICCLFVGRIVTDKGINELIRAFNMITQVPNFHLIIVGSEQNESDCVHPETKLEIEKNSRIHSLGFQSDVAFYMKSCDYICLPSYREGFGSVIIEAAACGIAAIGTDIPGLQDAIVHNETGILIPQKNVTALKNALLRMSTDHELRKTLGAKAFERALNQFNHKRISDLQTADYNSLLNRPQLKYMSLT